MDAVLKVAPTVVIGLGGTGKVVVSRIKKRLLKDLERVTGNPQIPPVVQLLALDSQKEREQVALPDDPDLSEETASSCIPVSDPFRPWRRN